MYGWSFGTASMDELGRLLRALENHRYLKEVDHRLHWSVDMALAALEPFGGHAAEFDSRYREASALDLTSRDPRLWRAAAVDEVVDVLTILAGESAFARAAREQLVHVLRAEGIECPGHAPFAAEVDEAPHPELVLLDWVLLPVDELDTERHAGALRAMAKAEEPVSASRSIYIEGPSLAEPELLLGCESSRLGESFIIWADGPYSYCDYLFRGVARAAKLTEVPLGYHDIDKP